MLCVKGQVGDIIHLVGCVVSVGPIQFCPCSVNATTDALETNGMPMFQ